MTKILTMVDRTKGAEEMKLDTLLTSGPWTLTGIVVLVASAVAGIVAFLANFLKSVEIIHNLKREKQTAAEAAPKAMSVVDVNDLGIKAFKTSSSPIKDMATGALIGGAAVEIVSHLHNHTPAESADHLDGSDAASDHSAFISDIHEHATDHADSFLDWIGDIFS